MFMSLFLWTLKRKRRKEKAPSGRYLVFLTSSNLGEPSVEDQPIPHICHSARKTTVSSNGDLFQIHKFWPVPQVKYEFQVCFLLARENSYS